MRNDNGTWDKQYRYDRDFMLAQLKEQADQHDALCEEVTMLRIKIAVMWTKVAGIAALVALIGGMLGGLLGGFIKLLPAILKALQMTVK
jgi:hypothetical protein